MTLVARSLAAPVLDARFLLVEALGQGGQGRVFRAFDRLHRRDVAIKMLHGDAARDPVPPMVAEFSVWARLRHPHVVRAYEMNRARSGPFPAGLPYLVLELVHGAPVHRALRAGAIAPEVVEELARRILRALDHVHREGLVHRDLKPGNVLVGPSRRAPGRVKLTDFGLASASGLAGTPGRISGSIPYVAPERILGLPLDGRADLYALGVLLHYLASGRLPIVTRSPQRWLRWHLSGPPADPRRARPGLPARLAELVVRLTTRDRDARPPTAAEALALLGPAVPAARCASASHLRPSDRAAMRLALDAARTGRVREISLPAKPDEARAARVELASLAAAAGAASVRLTRPPGAAHANVAQVVFALLLGSDDDVPSLLERHGLARGLPLSVVSGVPVWNRADHDADRVRRSRTLPSIARGVAAFVLGEARRRLVVLAIDRSSLGDPLAREVVSRLRAAELVRLRGEPRGGLLLAVPSAVSRLRTPADTEAANAPGARGARRENTWGI